MKVEELRKLVNEVVDEVEFAQPENYGALDAITKIQSYAKWAVKNIHRAGIKELSTIFGKIADITDKFVSTQSAKRAFEGYGIGKNDPKAAHQGDRWTVHYPSDDDWSKHKGSLDAVYEKKGLNKHEKEEMKLYKLIEKIAAKLSKLHSKPDYNEKEEHNLHTALKKALGKIDKLEKSEPDHD